MKVVYIAGPYRADGAWEIEQNIRRAEEAGLHIAHLGVTPLIPHTMTRFMQGTLTDKYWLEATLELMRRADALYLLNGWEASSGSRGEKAEAERLGLPVFYDSNVDDLIAWLRPPEQPPLELVEDGE